MERRLRKSKWSKRAETKGLIEKTKIVLQTGKGVKKELSEGEWKWNEKETKK